MMDAGATGSVAAAAAANGASTAAAPAVFAGSERLSAAVYEQLNLESVKARAVGLYKTIGRMLEDFDVYARANASPKWQDVHGQFSMISMELFNLVEDIMKVSKAFTVYPRNVNAETASILPVMLSSKLLPEMEAEDNGKREQLLYGITNQPMHIQIEKLKARIDMIAKACEAAEKVISDCRKAYGLGSRQGSNLVPTMDKAQVAKIQEQESLLRAAVNFGEGLRNVDQRQLSSSLPPSHLVDAYHMGEGGQNFGDNSGIFAKSNQTFSSTGSNNLGSMQATGTQLIGRSVPSPSGSIVAATFDNASTPAIPYANSPRPGAGIMNTSSPQQQQQQQRQRVIQAAQNQINAHQQQLRASSAAALLGQQPMQLNQPLSQQFQNRQLQSGVLQQNMVQNVINQGGQMRAHPGQFAGTGNNLLLNGAQASPNSQMVTNMPSAIQSQSLMPRMQFAYPQRTQQQQIINDSMFGVASTNPAGGMVAMQQQQGMLGNMLNSAHSLQTSMAGMPNTTPNPNLNTQRQLQNQQ